jgi:hypothetical protein
MVPICRHIKTDGARCMAIALRDRPYCYYHDRLHGVLTRRSSKTTKSFVLHPLEDRDSVFLALSDVVCGLAAGHVDPENATRLIHGLQVAGKFAPNLSGEVARDAVKSLDFTSTGDELAPVVCYCSPDDECDSCPSFASCSSKKARKWRAAHPDDEEDEDDSEEDGNNEVDEESDDEEEDEEDEDDEEEDGEEDDEDDEEDDSASTEEVADANAA